MKIIKWFKELAFVVANFRLEISRIHNGVQEAVRQERAWRNDEIAYLRRDAAALRKLIADRTEINASIGMRPGESYVVVCGKYRGVDYVETFDLPGGSLLEIVEHLHLLKQHGKIRRIDAAPHIKKIIAEKMRYNF